MKKIYTETKGFDSSKDIYVHATDGYASRQNIFSVLNDFFK